MATTVVPGEATARDTAIEGPFAPAGECVSRTIATSDTAATTASTTQRISQLGRRGGFAGSLRVAVAEDLARVPVQ